MEFVKGFDVTTLPEVEHCGGVFRDNGKEEDALSILKRYGGNWVRLWNDPYDAAGMDYGAGICDLPTVLSLARRTKNAGMDWLLDLHYSDFWADPGKQTVPKAWQGMNEAELEKAVYQYTKDVHCACHAAADAQEQIAMIPKDELTKTIIRQSVDALTAVSKSVEQLMAELGT